MERTELIERNTDRPSDFSYFGERPLFGTWGIFHAVNVLERDPTPLSESNFEEVIKELTKISPEDTDWEIVNFGHFVVGSIRGIIYNTENTEIVDALVDICDRLDDYPALNELDWCDREYEATLGVWNESSISERISYCSEARVSIFEARRDSMTMSDTMYEYIQTNFVG
jgi:hypothetical protein